MFINNKSKPKNKINMKVLSQKKDIKLRKKKNKDMKL